MLNSQPKLKAEVRFWGYDEVQDRNGLITTEPDFKNSYTDQGPIMSSLKYRTDMIFIRTIKYPNYYIQIDFSSQYNLSESFSDFYLAVEFANQNATRFLLAERYCFLIASLIVTALYGIHYYRCVMSDTESFEQTATLSILITLTLFNDPFFAIYVFNPNNASNFFSTLFVSIFAIFLISYWMRMMEYIAADRKPLEFGYVRIVIYVFLVISLFGSLLAYQVLTLKYPFFKDVKMNTAVIVLGVFNILTMVAVSFYLIFYAVKAIRKDAPILWREKIFMAFSFVQYVLSMATIIGLALSYLRYGKWSVTVVFHANMMVWVYCYMFTRVGQGKSENAEGEGTKEQMDGGNEYLDFESNKGQNDG